MSTAPLTLPTVEELKAAFPQATKVDVEEGRFLCVHFGKAHKFILVVGQSTPEFYVTARGGRVSGGAVNSDWVQALKDAASSLRRHMAQEAEKTQAAVAALDEAMKETVNEDTTT